MKYVYVYTLTTVKTTNEDKLRVKNASCIPFASLTEFNSNRMTACLGFCHRNTKRLIPLAGDYSLKNNDYYILGMSDRKNLGPSGGVILYYIMKVDEVLTYATAHERFPEWRAASFANPRHGPLPIVPIDNSRLLDQMKSKKLYVVSKNGAIINSYDFVQRSEEKKALWTKVKAKYRKSYFMFRVDRYDREFIDLESTREGGKHIKEIAGKPCILYRYIPGSHHSAVQIAFDDLAYERPHRQMPKRNGDRFFVSYSKNRFFGQTVTDSLDRYEVFEINDEIFKIFRKKIRSIRGLEYSKKVTKRTARGPQPHNKKINPLFFDGNDATRLLEIVAPDLM